MEKEASADRKEESDFAEEDSDKEDDRKMPAIPSNIGSKKTKHKKIQEGMNQSKLTFQYEMGERKDKKGRRSWTKTLVLSERDKMSIACTTHCSTNHDTVLAECIHILSSRLQYPYRSEGTPAYMREQIKNNGALYKEITHSITDNPRQQKFSVGSVMIYHRSLEFDKQDAIMITNLATAIAYQHSGMASSFLHDLCRLHSEDTHVFAMVMNACDIPDATAGGRSSNKARGSPEAFYYKYGFRTDTESNDNFHIDDEFIEHGCFLMKTTVRALKIKPKTNWANNIRTLDIDPN
eukprot:scaffold118065_cov34-Attheya_sp.AAC.1